MGCGEAECMGSAPTHIFRKIIGLVVRFTEMVRYMGALTVLK